MLKKQLQTNLFDITKYSKDQIIQVIPQENEEKFKKNKYKILQIEV